MRSLVAFVLLAVSTQVSATCLRPLAADSRETYLETRESINAFKAVDSRSFESWTASSETPEELSAFPSSSIFPVRLTLGDKPSCQMAQSKWEDTLNCKSDWETYADQVLIPFAATHCIADRRAANIDRLAREAEKKGLILPESYLEVRSHFFLYREHLKQIRGIWRRRIAEYQRKMTTYRNIRDLRDLRL